MALRHKKAVKMLQSGRKVAEFVRQTGLSRGIADRLNTCFQAREKKAEETVRNLSKNRAGRKDFISTDEHDLIKQSLGYNASRKLREMLKHVYLKPLDCSTHHEF